MLGLSVMSRSGLYIAPEQPKELSEFERLLG
jgi:hypothetical protein